MRDLQGAGVTRWRRPGADEILLVYTLLATIGFIWDWLLAPSAGKESTLATFLVTAFLAWRVSRGGRISRMILVLISGGSYVVAALSVARRWDFTFLALVIISAVQIALLVSPPVYGRTRPAPVQVRAQSWPQLLPPRPPAWLLPWGLLAGVLVTLACLGSMDFTTIAGCRPAASDACSALAEGYPLRWLTAIQGTPVISKEALLRDSVQWALGCTSLLYLAWLWLMPPADLSD
jgi:hypothetical protein